MSLQYVLLGLLNEKPRSGYDLNKSLKKYVRYFWEADQSRIYRSLGRLCQEGYVEFETVIQDQSPNKKIYSITESGRQKLQRWLSEPGKMMEEKQRSPFLVQLHFSDAIAREQQRQVLHARLKILRSELAELEDQAAVINMPFPLPDNLLDGGLRRGELTLAYGVLRYRFEIDWVEQLLRILA